MPQDGLQVLKDPRLTGCEFLSLNRFRETTSHPETTVQKFDHPSIEYESIVDGKAILQTCIVTDLSNWTKSYLVLIKGGNL